MSVRSKEEIRVDLMARVTSDGKLSAKGLTSNRLASWGVPWPPPKGWLKQLKAVCGFQVANSASSPVPYDEASTSPEKEAQMLLPLAKLAHARTVTIYTDGACLRNPGPGGWAATLTCDEYRREIDGADPATTNNRMELMAVIASLESLKQPCNVKLHSDSTYVINGITRWIHAWKRHNWIREIRRSEGEGTTRHVVNVDLWQRLDAAREQHDVEWIWVKGHSGSAENERCDALAVAAARKG
jgi:ribonuclease HI